MDDGIGSTRAVSDEGAAHDEHAPLGDREVAQLRLLDSPAHRTEVGALQPGAALARDSYVQRIGDETLPVRREASQAHAAGAQRKPGSTRHGPENRRRMPPTVGKQRRDSAERAGVDASSRVHASSPPPALTSKLRGAHWLTKLELD